MIASTIANANRDSNTEPYAPADFLPEWGRKAAEDDEEV